MGARLDGRVLAACAYGLAALPFHIAYGTATSGVIAVLVGGAAGVGVMAVTRSRTLWQYGIALALVGIPLAYGTGIGPALVGLLVALVGGLRIRGTTALTEQHSE